MGVKITKKLSLQKFLPETKRLYSNQVKKIMKKEITNTIKRGQSPVKGFGKFEKYSESYKKAIRKGQVKPKSKVAPVNLTVTGKMLRSLKIRKIRDGLLLFYQSKIAKYHDKPGLARVLRKMLPSENGLTFIDSIFKKMTKSLEKSVRTSTKRQK